MTSMAGLPKYVFAPLPVPTLPIAGSDAVFPIHRIYCVGRNYADHALEMGGDPTREPPFFFQKNPDTIVLSGSDFPYPSGSKQVEYEIELVVALKSGGTNIALDKALDHVFGYAVGNDMTRRDLQGEAKKMGRPWETGKAFESSALCSPLVPVATTGHPAKGAIWLKVNGVTKQQGNLDQLIWKLPEVIFYLSGLFELRAGDLIYTGTPAGVGPVVRGDVIEGGVDGVGTMSNKVV